MTTQKKVPVTKAIKYPLGHAKEAKDASAYTGFVYPEGGGNDMRVYKQPMMNPNGDEKDAITKTGSWTNEVNMSVAAGSKGNYKPTNPYGVGEMRGYGAATKGRKISGKMG
jgi:hypothetical protein